MNDEFEIGDIERFLEINDWDDDARTDDGLIDDERLFGPMSLEEIEHWMRG